VSNIRPVDCPCRHGRPVDCLLHNDWIVRDRRTWDRDAPLDQQAAEQYADQVYRWRQHNGVHDLGGGYLHYSTCWCGRGRGLWKDIHVGVREPRGLNYCGYQAGVTIAQWTTSKEWRPYCQFMTALAALIVGLIFIIGFSTGQIH
jgi:hypothetical protein